MNLRNLFRRKPRPAGVDTEIWRAVARHPKKIVKPASLLRPDDIRDKTFTTHWFREGYDMGEVDDYLDEVRVTVNRLARTCRSLSQELAAKQLEVCRYRRMVMSRGSYTRWLKTHEGDSR